MTEKTRRRYHYSAKEGYQHDRAPSQYERKRFSSPMGRYRHGREQKAVASLVDRIPAGAAIADCPCGMGRWWPVLARRAGRIVAMDVSQSMLRASKERALSGELDIEIEVREGDAENLPLEDASVDYTFSYALTRHLPLPVQFEVLGEFARISRMGVISSFSLVSHVSYEFWRRRRLKESYVVLPEQLEWMAAEANLEIEDMRKSSTPIGVEQVVLFRKLG